MPPFHCKHLAAVPWLGRLLMPHVLLVLLHHVLLRMVVVMMVMLLLQHVLLLLLLLLLLQLLLHHLHLPCHATSQEAALVGDN